ncbi:glycoside hydrolase family 3 N-terminal domain-containing protein [Microbacterium suwonense]|uniref:beta-N-acetylhexosaminidase n=1 Tax=Microbacterium suwonense TaxID=683047 RepID=A0ABM8FQT1_9MICO|nr:glycoside hydrolase family 3 N-terminal domain-containing protein [Microbacterium suwonense]BDZ38020.1 hypothetical protein GCM10025863_06340 [Microbacterium suwonense]
MRRAGWGAVAGLLVAVVVAGCAPSAGPAPNAPTTQRTPSATPTPTPTLDPAEAAVAQMSVEQRARSVVMGHVPGTDTTVLRDYMSSGLGGFILMSDNISGGPDQVRAVTAALTVDPQLPPLIAIDQEGGVVSRLSWDALPAGRGLQSADAASVESAFAGRAELVAAVGANVNFGIIADVPLGPTSFIASRALGTDADSAATRVRAAVQGRRASSSRR